MPGQVDGVGPGGQSDESVKLHVLQSEAIAAEAASVQHPHGKFQHVRRQLYVELCSAMRRNEHAARDADIHSTQSSVARVAEVRCNRVKSIVVPVIVNLDSLMKCPRLVERLVSERKTRCQVIRIPGCRCRGKCTVHPDFTAANPGDWRKSARLSVWVDLDICFCRIHEEGLDL